LFGNYTPLIAPLPPPPPKKKKKEKLITTYM
jgi:hypothetical protein